MRSKTLLVSNIISSIYAGIFLCRISGGIIAAGGIEYIELLTQSFSILNSIIAEISSAVTVIYVMMSLLLAHVGLFTIGALMGWAGYFFKKSGTAKFAGVLYLLGTICFPIYIFFGLPITIIGFVGANKQKKINKSALLK